PPGLDFAKTWATVTVTLRDGRTLEARCDRPRGRWDFPLSRAERLAKFHDCARRVLQPEKAEQVAAVVETIETVENAQELMLLLSVGSQERN
ncbi:MAG: MmgE/PrpD family protein, partial [Deltaproteobacteria bacterium]|nr:MmgE/PrpD family protein [Deltaproteobacteria bacterium]